MRRWHWIVISFIGGIALFLAICWLWSGPCYQGRSLNSWVRGLGSYIMTNERRLESAEAVRHIGTNAVPSLIKQLGRKPTIREPEWRLNLRVTLAKANINLPRPADVRGDALAALDALGPVAKDAAPALERLLHENRPDYRALMVLAQLGPDGVPALTRALTNDQRLIRMSARACLEMEQTHSEVLFPRNPQDADFLRKTTKFNLEIIKLADEEYRAQHPDEFSTTGVPHPSPAPHNSN